uniref:Insulin gene enhancer protein ISL-1,LIM domain-binding protein 1 n=1 Tax=Mus musculus TaxID=10090 RepID=UPI00034F2382|nr:Chain A, Insulin gene enhancer protein ISL-1,LIM domain-binding protein 1 [Mus musculus]4JCJ_B Chain B, Insulin gene enhancer protein ISL-1,LIM domain-binding protein 1 [Mus musculus]4JCJ_C Chain C, Insulin gene enhancer protein ISL-1,LIM domain-binding protein 1 [Mus musculus]
GSKRLISLCVGCGNQIHDQYILRVSPDLEWHAACLKCAECNQYLDESCTCFVRDGKTYCKRDYIRLYGIKCAKCSIGFSKNDFVMRARSKVYHIECFRCVACSRQLIPGDEFALREDGLFCRADHDVVERGGSGGHMGSGGGDVMVVGEPTLMGGEFGDEDERLITRLENTQF